MMILMYWLSLLATVSLISSQQCDMTPTPTQMVGKIQGISCINFSNFSWAAGQCILHCYHLNKCRVAFLQCQDLECACILCQGVHAIDFTKVDKKFYLKGQVLGENLSLPPYRRWNIPDGNLEVGQVIIARVVLATTNTKLFLTYLNLDIALFIQIKVGSRTVARSTRINWQFSPQETEVPYFNFTVGQEIEVVYVIRSDEYWVYFDKTIFFTYHHQISLEAVVFFEATAIGSMGVISYAFIS